MDGLNEQCKVTIILRDASMTEKTWQRRSYCIFYNLGTHGNDTQREGHSDRRRIYEERDLVLDWLARLSEQITGSLRDV